MILNPDLISMIEPIWLEDDENSFGSGVWSEQRETQNEMKMLSTSGCDDPNIDLYSFDDLLRPKRSNGIRLMIACKAPKLK